MSVELLHGKRRFDHDGRFDIVAHNWNTPRLYAAALGGSLATAFVAHPLDTLKIHAQVGPRLETRRPLFYTYAYIKTYGIRTLYRGFNPVLSASFLSAAIRLGGTYQFSTNQTPIPLHQAYSFAILGSVAAAMVYTRFDTCVVRMQADSAMPLGYRRFYTSVQDCLRRMRFEEGRWAFTRGVSLGWLRFGIHMSALIYLAPTMQNLIGGDNFYSAVTTLMIVNFFTSVITMPIDAGKVVIQTQPMVQPLLPYPKKIAWAIQAVLRLAMETALRPFKWEPKARAFLLLERYKEPPRPYYYPFSARKIIPFLRKRSFWHMYNGFWFYFWKNCAMSILPYAIVEKVGKKHKI